MASKISKPYSKPLFDLLFFLSSCSLPCPYFHFPLVKGKFIVKSPLGLRKY